MNQPTCEPDPHRTARALLTHLAMPPDPVMSCLLAVMDPSQVLDCIRARAIPSQLADQIGEITGLTRALDRWRHQLAALPADGGIAAAARAGIRLVCPGDGEWPTRLDDLGTDRPCALWARGPASLYACCVDSVAVVGSRAATAYGTHVASVITADLAAAGMAVISGAAVGIDAAAHSAALATSGVTVAVLACGSDVAYPRQHAKLLDNIAAHGVIVSEYPPGQHPTRSRFVARNRIIAALASGLVVVEAGVRGGTMNAARHAGLLGRKVMAVPGPVTSAASAGCHELIRSHAAVCVTSASDVLTHLGL